MQLGAKEERSEDVALDRIVGDTGKHGESLMRSEAERSPIQGKKWVSEKWRPLTPLGMPVDPEVKESVPTLSGPSTTLVLSPPALLLLEHIGSALRRSATSNGAVIEQLEGRTSVRSSSSSWMHLRTEGCRTPALASTIRARGLAPGGRCFDAKAVGRVDHAECRAGLERTENSDDEVDTTMGVGRNDLLALHTCLEEMVSDHVGGAVELAVGDFAHSGLLEQRAQRASPIVGKRLDDAPAVRVRTCVALKDLCDGAAESAPLEVLGGVRQEGVLLRRANGQAADRGGWVGGSNGDELGELGEDELHALRGEEQRVVRQVHGDVGHQRVAEGVGCGGCEEGVADSAGVAAVVESSPGVAPGLVRKTVRSVVSEVDCMKLRALPPVSSKKRTRKMGALCTPSGKGPSRSARSASTRLTISSYGTASAAASFSTCWMRRTICQKGSLGSMGS